RRYTFIFPRPHINPLNFVRIVSVPVQPLFFFNDTATTEIYTLSLHDALPISPEASAYSRPITPCSSGNSPTMPVRSEEHTSELQSHLNLVCRLRLEKKKE